RTFSRAEEIAIMQLVGGSLWFIRAPFVLEGAFYGFLGSLVSTSVIFVLTYVIFVLNRNTSTVNFLVNLLGNLKWPHLDLLNYLEVFVALVLFGALIGGLNSLIAIKRYIK